MKRKVPLVTVILLVIIVGAAGYGLVTAHASNAAPSTSSDLSQPTVLHVTRTSGVPINLPPLDRTVRDAAAVQRLYSAAYKLPTIPANAVFNCPMSRGIVYHLQFMRGTTPLQAMDLQADGCPFLQIGKSVRQTTPTFISLLAKTLGIPSLIPANT